MHDSGDKVDQDTVQLNWTGNGVPVDQKCGDSADPGHPGYENGATADNYMLWLSTTDGGATTGLIFHDQDQRNDLPATRMTVTRS